MATQDPLGEVAPAVSHKEAALITTSAAALFGLAREGGKDA